MSDEISLMVDEDEGGGGGGDDNGVENDAVTNLDKRVEDTSSQNQATAHANDDTSSSTNNDQLIHEAVKSCHSDKSGTEIDIAPHDTAGAVMTVRTTSQGGLDSLGGSTESIEIEETSSTQKEIADNGDITDICKDIILGDNAKIGLELNDNNETRRVIHAFDGEAIASRSDNVTVSSSSGGSGVIDAGLQQQDQSIDFGRRPSNAETRQQIHLSPVPTPPRSPMPPAALNTSLELNQQPIHFQQQQQQHPQQVQYRTQQVISNKLTNSSSSSPSTQNQYISQSQQQQSTSPSTSQSAHMQPNLAMRQQQSVMPDGPAPETNFDSILNSPITGRAKDDIVEKSPGERYLRFSEKLGSGAYKEVYRAYDTIEGIEVAWNVVNLSGVPKSERQYVVNEVRLLEKLNHSNIISFHGSWVNRELEQVIFVTEILSSGTLKSFINKVQVIRWKIAKRWAKQILNGLKYLHSQDPPIIHRDLKCDNIFINGTSGDLRIGDLGLSTGKSTTNKALSVLGTPEFMAPELYNESYDQQVDIYAFGMCMLEIFTKEVPYRECTNPAQIYKKVSSGVEPESLSRIKSSNAREFIRLCLGKPDANGDYKRPDATQLLEHSFLAKREDDDSEVLVDPLNNEGSFPEQSKQPVQRQQQPNYQSSVETFHMPLINEVDVTEDRGSSRNSTQNDFQVQQQVIQGDNLSINGLNVSSPDLHMEAQNINDSAYDMSSQPGPQIPQGESDNRIFCSVDHNKSDEFSGMPDREINIKNVTVLMGRGQQISEDDYVDQNRVQPQVSSQVMHQNHVQSIPMQQSSTNPMNEHPVHQAQNPLPTARSPSSGRPPVAPPPILMGNSIAGHYRKFQNSQFKQPLPGSDIGSTTGSVSSGSQGCTFKYVVEADMIDHEESGTINITITVADQTVRFNYDPFQDDPIQVAREMVNELNFPDDAVLEISETISHLARNARVRIMQQQQQPLHANAMQDGNVMQKQQSMPPFPETGHIFIREQQQQVLPPHTNTMQDGRIIQEQQQQSIPPYPGIANIQDGHILIQEQQQQVLPPHINIMQDGHIIQEQQQQLLVPPYNSSQDALTMQDRLQPLPPITKILQEGYSSTTSSIQNPNLSRQKSEVPIGEASVRFVNSALTKPTSDIPNLGQEVIPQNNQVNDASLLNQGDGDDNNDDDEPSITFSSLELGDDLDMDDSMSDSSEIQKLKLEFNNQVKRSFKAYDTRMENLKRSKLEKEALHQKTVDKYKKEQTAFEKRKMQAQKEQKERVQKLKENFEQQRLEALQSKKLSAPLSDRSHSTSSQMASVVDVETSLKTRIENSSILSSVEERKTESMSSSGNFDTDGNQNKGDGR